jgi:hypothetical protein
MRRGMGRGCSGGGDEGEELEEAATCTWILSQARQRQREGAVAAASSLRDKLISRGHASRASVLPGVR